eukprot:CAMPEP_0184679638 /NCGR_PEP_ID=MMETSP0312-20130426/2476_1 /TAXON_ID=31354 /ORGANISM="Compsopogon coeruleus, Strain SAG 36.94" /LENGTH=573 /DNA_ID=CAMNT_0027129205 /DNA_START=2018 /DNA_END=3739 /DNA_ORIENTATION=+
MASDSLSTFDLWTDTSISSLEGNEVLISEGTFLGRNQVTNSILERTQACTPSSQEARPPEGKSPSPSSPLQFSSSLALTKYPFVQEDSMIRYEVTSNSEDIQTESASLFERPTATYSFVVNLFSRGKVLDTSQLRIFVLEALHHDQDFCRCRVRYSEQVLNPSRSGLWQNELRDGHPSVQKRVSLVTREHWGEKGDTGPVFVIGLDLSEELCDEPTENSRLTTTTSRRLAGLGIMITAFRENTIIGSQIISEQRDLFHGENSLPPVLLPIIGVRVIRSTHDDFTARFDNRQEFLSQAATVHFGSPHQWKISSEVAGSLGVVVSAPSIVAEPDLASDDGCGSPSGSSGPGVSEVQDVSRDDCPTNKADRNRDVNRKFEPFFARHSLKDCERNSMVHALTLEELALFFCLPRDQVASGLGICVTLLKKIAKRHGVRRWPYRKLRPIHATIEKKIRNARIWRENERTGFNPRRTGRVYEGEIERLIEIRNTMLPSILGPNAISAFHQVESQHRSLYLEGYEEWLDHTAKLSTPDDGFSSSNPNPIHNPPQFTAPVSPTHALASLMDKDFGDVCYSF